MGYRSVVFGHIHTLNNDSHEANKHALHAFPYDDVHPFRDIFYLEDPVKYKAPSIIFGGTFKEIEADWLTWFERFTTLLSTLEAVEANVILDCIFGRYAWTLKPQWLALDSDVATRWKEAGTMTGQQWYIVQAPTFEGNLQDLLHPVRTPVQIDPDHIYGY